MYHLGGLDIALMVNNWSKKYNTTILKMATTDEIINGSREIRKVISRALEDDEGAIIGRNGSIELTCILDPDHNHHHILERNAGIFPVSQLSIFNKWRSLTIEATKSADILVKGWYKPLLEAEDNAFKQWNIQAINVPLRSLEPYYVKPNEQWTQLLKGHRVSVVSSFTQSARMQLESPVKLHPGIWGNHCVVPDDIIWSWVQTGHPPSVAKGSNDWPPHIHNWLQAAEYVVSEVVSQGARFALIGCGGLSMPIAKMLKDRGIIAIVLGGAIQVLFGIKGKRWVNHEIISTLWNDQWIWPSKDETPANACVVEGGCYWRG
jgi:hypothetical protein